MQKIDLNKKNISPFFRYTYLKTMLLSVCIKLFFILHGYFTHDTHIAFYNLETNQNKLWKSEISIKVNFMNYMLKEV